MSKVQVAIYGRVSSEQQAAAQTIESQLESLRERVRADGNELGKEMEFTDDGYSGATLVRPALERLRDLVVTGMVDRVYVHSPDRLARKYAYQVLLVDEFRGSGVEIVFLNRELGQSPEDELLLQVQGMMAEYERAKIIERNRRGRRHAASKGSVSVLTSAPYGYRYVRKQDGREAEYQIVSDEARVVRQIFEWVGKERLPLMEICRRLRSAGETTRKGNQVWDRSTVWGMLKNPAYKGTAGFGKTRTQPWRPGLRPQRGHGTQPRRAQSSRDVPEEEWIKIPVPPIVDLELFEVVQEQLSENQRRARLGKKGARYLLQGLICCGQCGYAFCAVGGNQQATCYYRCSGTNGHRFGGQKVCNNKPIRTDSVERAVWEEVRGVLEDPDRLAEEYRRRLESPHANDGELKRIQKQVTNIDQAIGRLIDAYGSGLITAVEFEPRIKQMRERAVKLTVAAKQLVDERRSRDELRLIVGRLQEFSGRIKSGLDTADWATQRDVIRALVKRIEVAPNQVNLVFRITPRPFDQRPERGDCEHCWRLSVPAPSFGLSGLFQLCKLLNSLTP